MISTVRRLTNEEISTYIDIVINAYPGFTQNTPDFKERFYNNLVELQENEESIEFYGLFKEEKLVGGMRIHYFTMNLYNKMISVGGIGLVAVDLLHKKEKVAKEMVQYYIDHFRAKGNSLVMLYPFRPDFYKKMGFGYGMKMNQYQIEPSSFPSKESKESIVFLNDSHKELVRDCYNQYALNTHGMVLKTNNELNAMYKNPNYRLVGYMQDGKLDGYLLFSIKKTSETNFIMQNLLIHEFIFHTPDTFAKINSFIHSQADQISRVVFNTQDPYLQYLFQDPRNGSNNLIPSVYHETNTAGVGIMYKIINLDSFIDQVQFNKVDCTFKLIVSDSFYSAEPTIKIVNLEEGFHIPADKDTQFDIEIDISDLSSLMLGSVDVMKLYEYGLLKISNPAHLETFNSLFVNRKRPLITTGF